MAGGEDRNVNWFPIRDNGAVAKLIVLWKSFHMQILLEKNSSVLVKHIISL